MSFRRVFIPIAMFLTLMLQFVPGTVFAPQPVGAQPCNAAQFIADETVPDGTVVAPGSTFVKTWRLENVGSCTWSTSFAAVFTGGDQMGAPSVVYMPTSVAPSSTVDISVNLTAPSSSGHYRGNWELRDASGNVFGVGASANSIFWVDIYVSGTYTGGTSYDFMANACSASWSSGAGTLPCPGTDGNSGGFVLPVNSPQLENGTTDPNPGLVVNPQQVSGGYIQGVYPAYTVQSGDHFQGIVNCTYNSPSCYVNFRLMYQIGSGPVQTFWSFNERYDGLYYRFNLDLSSLAGQSVNFILYTADVSGHGVPSGDRAEWVETKIAGNGSGGGTYYPYYPSTCNRGYFVTDVTIPDRTVLAPGTAFTKTWEIRNVGSCTWTTSYALVYVFGNPLGAASPVYLPASVAPGATADFSVNMVAPSVTGHYRSYWRFQDASGNQFGVGSGMITFFADIYVSYSGGTSSNATYTTITAHSPNPSTPGQPVAVSVTVSGSGPTPTGTVAITGADTNCTVTLSGGSGSCNVVFNSNGNRTISAIYGGDLYNASSSASVIHTITTATTPSTTTITGNTPNPSTPGQLVAVTVTVSGSIGTPTGTVAITGADGNCTITLTSGSGTCNVSFNSAGPKMLTASYSGSASYAGSSTTASQTVNKGPTATVITANTPNPAATGQSISVSATVSGAGPTPTGTVTLTGADTNCTFSLASGSGSCNSVVFNTTGTKTITATYNGDGNYNGSSGTASETVVPAKLVPTVTITGDVPDPSTPGQTVVVGVTVSSTGATPTGTVAISGADTNCTITLAPSLPSQANGTCNVVFNTTGAKTLTANYTGDSNYTTGSATESHTVTPGTSTLVITSHAPNPSTVGQSVTVTVTVSGAGGTPTGTVAITGADTNCTITLAGGSGSCNVVFNTVGAKVITATYSGDMNYTGSSITTPVSPAPGFHNVVQGPSTTTITSELPDPSAVGGTVVVTVTVTGAGATPTGTVSVTSVGGGSPNCPIAIIGGTGSCNLIFSSTGSFPITATYNGDGNYTTSNVSKSHAVN
ncbi:MAG: Ig-like domain repeat protein [Anaerolineales bacterium]